MHLKESLHSTIYKNSVLRYSFVFAWLFLQLICTSRCAIMSSNDNPGQLHRLEEKVAGVYGIFTEAFVSPHLS